MASTALGSLTTAVQEVQHLLGIVPIGGPLPIRLARARVVGRASVVLLASHFERYFYAVNEEAVAFLNTARVSSERIPEQLRLLHSADAIDRIIETEWTNRAAQLVTFVSDEAWLWITGQSGTFRAEKLLMWMKSPKPEALIRYFAYWGITNIFDATTRAQTTKGRMILLVRELVDKRNNIAHGDFAEQATRLDVQRYANTALTFCGRADRVLSKTIAHRFGIARPW